MNKAPPANETVTKRRLSWSEFKKLMEQVANDNKQAADKAAA
ncbi:MULTISPECIES: hypothetical protein [unclassified Mesorhizobium]|nr:MULTISPECIES: hypothetical protein [unclassified Mesorhizobium]MDG4854063.1 hypothetical protein [Mesorhizobium sp. WSM4982]MDG4910921.1 hypothetical protein [Mesorhizobium sp. WSM4983]